MAAEKGFGRSNGCAYADSPGHIPMQRMPNVSLQPAPDGPTTEELISGVDRGIYIVGDKSWSIDMQRYNFQFTGQRFFKIADGRLDGQLKDVAYQATTTDFWRSMEAVGNADTYQLGGAFNCGKGQPGQVAPVSHGCPSALFRRVNVLNTQAEGRSSRAGDRGPATGGAGARTRHAADRVAVVTERIEANLRWASNALTTNGEMRSVTLTVICTAAVEGGTSAGTVSQEISDPAAVAGVVAEAERLARSGSAAEDARRRWPNYPHSDAGTPDRRRPGSRSSPSWPGTRRSLRPGRAAEQLLFGFAEHVVSTLSRQQHRVCGDAGCNPPDGSS